MTSALGQVLIDAIERQTAAMDDGELIEALRKVRHVNRYRLATSAGTTVATLALIERKSHVPQDAELMRRLVALLTTSASLRDEREDARAAARTLFAMPQFAYMNEPPAGAHVKEMTRLFGPSPF